MTLAAQASARQAPQGPLLGSETQAEYLSFRLGAEEYGIEILKVQEIRGYDAPTAIANAPDFIKGVINLRGVIVPILDLRIKFHLNEARYDDFTVVIILNVAGRATLAADAAGAACAAGAAGAAAFSRAMLVARFGPRRSVPL